MASRRSFVKHLAGVGAGVLFGGAGLSGLQTGPRRRLVTVGGRRVKTVDVHAHTFVPAVAEAVKGTPLEATVTASLSGGLVIGEERLRQMNQQGIDVEVLSINPWWYSADRDRARRIVDLQNQGLAGICAAQPDRFVALATVAMQFPDIAVEQLEAAFSTHKMRGVSLGAVVNGDELASSKFDPFWAKVEQLGAFVFIHPQGVPELGGRLQGNGLLTNVIGNPLETTIALAHLIFEGTLDRFPRLRICGAHGGGFLPSYKGRFDQGCVTFPARCTKTLKKRPSEYLNQLYFDSLVFTSEGLRHLVAEFGSSQIVMATDYPFPWTSTSVDHILKTPGLGDVDRIAMLGGNLSRLLGIAQ